MVFMSGSRRNPHANENVCLIPAELTVGSSHLPHDPPRVNMLGKIKLASSRLKNDPGVGRSSGDSHPKKGFL